MVTLRRDHNGNFSARKRLPADVADEYGRRYGQRFEAKFFAAASKGTAEAKRLFQEWEAEVAKRVAAIRAAQRGEGIDLSRKEALGLAGEWYKLVCRSKALRELVDIISLLFERAIDFFRIGHAAAPTCWSFISRAARPNSASRARREKPPRGWADPARSVETCLDRL